MFKPKTERIRQIHNSDVNKNIIKKCESLFHDKTNVYIDFADTIKTLLNDKKNVLLFATAGRIANELSELVSKGLFIFDIRDLKDFICWKKELKLTLKSTKDPNNGASQL